MPQGSGEAKSLTGLLQEGDNYVDNEDSRWLKEWGNLSHLLFPLFFQISAMSTLSVMAWINCKLSLPGEKSYFDGQVIT